MLIFFENGLKRQGKLTTWLLNPINRPGIIFDFDDISYDIGG